MKSASNHWTDSKKPLKICFTLHCSKYLTCYKTLWNILRLCKTLDKLTSHISLQWRSNLHTCPNMVLAKSSARLDPLIMSAALKNTCARSSTGLRSHSLWADSAALMALLIKSCKRGKRGNQFLFQRENNQVKYKRLISLGCELTLCKRQSTEQENNSYVLNAERLSCWHAVISL